MDATSRNRNRTFSFAFEIETGLISLLLHCPERIQEVGKAINFELISQPHLQTMYAAIVGLAAEGVGIDFNTVAQRLRDIGKFDEIGGRHGLDGIYGHPFYDNSAIVADYLRILRESAAERSGEILSIRQYNERECADLFIVRAPQLRCVGSDWFAYTLGTWSPREKDSFRPMALGTMHLTIQTARRETQILNLVEGLKQVPESRFCGVYKLGGEDVLINAQNGVIRVRRSGYQLEPHSPEHGFTQQLAVEFNRGAKCALFLETLSQALPDPLDRALLQICAGNILYPSSKYEVCLIAYGPSGTGKSTLLESGIASIFNTDSVQNLSLAQLCDHKGYALPNLRQAALNLSTELDAIEVGESSNWKSLVSGEPISARAIYAKPETLQTTVKLCFLTNGLPRFHHGTDAELRRVRFIRFEQKPACVDFDLKKRIRSEASGILVWMLEGLVHLLQTYGIPFGGETTRRVYETFSVQNDPLGTFVKECCILAPDAVIEKSILGDAYGEFLEEHGLPVEQLKRAFFQRLYQAYPDIKSSKKRIDGKLYPVVYGISTKEEE
jgi:P4 family phage/plasmid primase-like protien